MKANWGTDALHLTLVDPFAPPREEDERALDLLVEREGALAHQGVVCEIKERNWTRPTCLACRYRTPEEICEVGVKQERVVGRLDPQTNSA